MNEIDALAARLRPHYSWFLDPLGEEVLLTGHSHQAWPDVARDGVLAAFEDAARHVDRKWGRVFGEILPEFQARVARRIGSSRPKDLALGPNTHELVARLLGCFPERGTVLTTDSEFHSLRRQLARLSEEGLRVVKVAADDGGSFAERFIEAARRERPMLAALSSVFFNTGRVVAELELILGELASLGIPVLVDAYHAFNAIEMSTDRWPGRVFVVAGGYKYAQCGEGACWMLLPEDASSLRPRNTGWFADFEHLEAAGATVEYASGGQRFLGATFDPTSLYRATWVLRFLDDLGLTPALLREQSLRQTSLILCEVARLGLEGRGLRVRSARDDEDPRRSRGAFVALEVREATSLSDRLRRRGVHTDVRGELLRLGPAPYLDAESIRRAMATLASEV